MKVGDVLVTIREAYADAPLDEEVTLLDLLSALAAAGLEGAAEHSEAERRALTVKTAARAAQGELITYAEAAAHAPNRLARRLVEARGQCKARCELKGAVTLRCELVHGHATSGIKGNEKHAMKRGGEAGIWVRW